MGYSCDVYKIYVRRRKTTLQRPVRTSPTQDTHWFVCVVLVYAKSPWRSNVQETRKFVTKCSDIRQILTVLHLLIETTIIFSICTNRDQSLGAKCCNDGMVST